MSTRVLIVDDDFMVARIHRKFVEAVEGFEVIGESRTGAEAISAIAELQPDLVLLDIYLPDMSGLDVLARVRQEGHSVDVLVVTAARDAETVREALRGGAVHYVIKPFTGVDLRARLLEFQAMRGTLRRGEVSQGDVDALFGAAQRPAPGLSDLPKGLTVETLKLVASALRQADGDLGADECADGVGLARVSARRYLEHLVQAGYADVSLRYGRAGRPQRRYRWTADSPS